MTIASAGERAYGPGRYQFGRLHRARAGPAKGTVVLIHGGFWRPHRGLEMTEAAAHDLARRGWHCWNVEYRRRGQGSWRATLEDCGQAVDRLVSLGLARDPVLLAGHSAGGHLAVWCANRGRAARWCADHGCTAREDAAVRPRGVVSLAGVLDLRHAALTRVGDEAVAGFLGGLPSTHPERYELADPIARLPVGVPIRCLHSPQDERVPFEQSVRYVRAATAAGDDASLIEIQGTHADVLRVDGPGWAATLSALDALGHDATTPGRAAVAGRPPAKPKSGPAGSAGSAGDPAGGAFIDDEEGPQS